METFKKKRLDIVIESLVLRKLIEILDKADVSGYTVLSAQAGSGTSGPWQAEGVLGGTNELRVVFCIIDEDKVQPLLEPLLALVARHIGVVTVSDVEVIRKDRFR
ncbi:MAG: DUF190 domain-containing protein [Pseudomonadota bacterium]